MRGHRSTTRPGPGAGRAPLRRRLVAAGFTTLVVLTWMVARSPGAAAHTGKQGSATAAGPEGDGGALALWILAEVVVLVAGVAALRIWTDRRTPRRPHGRTAR